MFKRKLFSYFMRKEALAGVVCIYLQREKRINNSSTVAPAGINDFVIISPCVSGIMCAYGSGRAELRKEIQKEIWHVGGRGKKETFALTHTEHAKSPAFSITTLLSLFLHACGGVQKCIRDVSAWEDYFCSWLVFSLPLYKRTDARKCGKPAGEVPEKDTAGDVFCFLCLLSLSFISLRMHGASPH